MTKKISDDNELSIYEHIYELRYRLLFCLGAIVFFTVITSFFTSDIFFYLRKAALFPHKLIFFGPYDGFLAHFKIALFTGVAVSFPIILYEIWMFIVPGLYENERKMILPFIFWGSLFFFSGIVFAYFTGIRTIMEFMLGFGTDYNISAKLDVNKYLSFVLLSAFSFGMIFEWPVLIYFMARLGIISAFTLARNRKYAFLIAFIISAVITPSDIISLFIFAIPFYLLYEAGIFMTKFVRII